MYTRKNPYLPLNVTNSKFTIWFDRTETIRVNKYYIIIIIHN